MNYYLSADCGGSSSSFVLVSEDGRILAQKKEGPCGLMANGTDYSVRLISNTVSRMLKKNGIHAEDVSACFGLSGFGDEEKRSRQFLNALFASLPGMRIALGNDSMIAIAGSLGGKSGIHIICGTGSSVIGLDTEGNRVRTGGWYHLFGGDEGSAYWIGCHLIQEFTKQSDGRHERTAVGPYMMQKYGLSNEHEMLNLVIEKWQCRREKLADVCMDCCALAMAKDPAAMRIIDDAASEQAELIKACQKRGNFEIPTAVSYSGGVFRSGDLILKPLKEKLGSGFDVRKPLYSPLAGGVILAAQNAGKTVSEEVLKQI